MATNPPKRQKSDIQEYCQSCSTVCSYDNLTQFRFLCSEKHAVCSSCYASSVAKIRRSTLLGLVCPCCDEECTSYQHGYTEEGATIRSGTRVGAREPKTYVLDDLDLDQHPVQYHRSLDDQKHNFVTLSVSYAKKDSILENKTACVSTNSTPDDLGEKAIGVIQAIGRLFHALLIGMATISLVQEVPTMEELCSLAFNCYSPLMRFVYCLCYGQTVSQVEEQADHDDKSWLKLRVQIFVITDLISNIRSKGTGLIQQTVGLILRANNVGQNVYNKLNELGFCRSYRTELRTKISNFASAIREGLTQDMKFTKWDLLLVIFDNIGFHRGGSAARVGYLQMTLLIMGRQELVFDKIFLEALLYFRDLNLFGPGPPEGTE